MIDDLTQYKRALAELVVLGAGISNTDEDRLVRELDRLWYALSADQREQAEEFSAQLDTGEVDAAAFFSCDIAYERLDALRPFKVTQSESVLSAIDEITSLLAGRLSIGWPFTADDSDYLLTTFRRTQTWRTLGTTYCPHIVGSEVPSSRIGLFVVLSEQQRPSMRFGTERMLANESGSVANPLFIG